MKGNAENAIGFLGSVRGRILVGDALRIAIKKLEKVEGARREVSNIENMKFLLEHYAVNIPRNGY